MFLSRFFVFLLLAPALALADEIVTLKTRGDETQAYLLVANPGAKPKAVALMFTGGEGLLRLPADVSQLKFGPRANFLVRVRGMFRKEDFAAAIVDSPSDRQRAGMNDYFRTGSEHVEDITAVLKDLRGRFPGAKVFLVGTSRGTISAAHVGRSLGNAVDGVVLTSTVFLGGGRGIGLNGFEFGAIKTPLLFVHHIYDGCRATPYNAAESLGKTWPLITVKGGKPAESDECEPLAAHGYYGMEEPTVAAIKNWMLGRPYPKLVE